YFQTQPALQEQIQLASNAVCNELSVLPDLRMRGLTLVEGGGTARALTSLLTREERAPIIPRTDVIQLKDRLLTMTPQAIRRLNPKALSGREDICSAALIILDTVMEYFGFEAFVASSGGLRHGLALAAADAL
ncbi:MAG: hypothetical protein R3284_12385, partial [Rubricoccaceae bacterium]|nr:hypothetical protein [Rubricoccaceae bacterium]